VPHPIVYAEIRSKNPDATREFFADLLGWTYPDPGAIPGYTFVDTGVPRGAVKRASELGGQVVQEPQHVPGVAFALIADPQGHVIGLTQQG
jgi:uncharacterized protein